GVVRPSRPWAGPAAIGVRVTALAAGAGTKERPGPREKAHTYSVCAAHGRPYRRRPVIVTRRCGVNDSRSPTMVGVSDLPRRAVTRSAKLATLPLGFAGRTAL